MVLDYLGWVTGTQSDFLRWANLHWKCGWDIEKPGKFKFSNTIKKELRDAPLNDWFAGTVPSSSIGLEYRELAERVIKILTETVNKEWLQDKASFYKAGIDSEDYINKGDKKHPYPTTV